MLTESDLKIGGRYLYWSPSRQCHIRIVYVGKRKAPGTDEDILVFRDSSSLNEIWSTPSLINIVVDDGWLEKFVNEKDE